MQPRVWGPAGKADRTSAVQAAALRSQDTVRRAEASGQLRVIGGFYEIGSGAVDFLTEAEDLLS